MGLLGNMLKNTISDGINKGIRKGVSNAVENAVEKAVKPKVEDWANKTADNLTQAAQATTDSLNQAAQATADGMQATANSVNNAGGTAGLEGALARLQSSMENYATQASKNLKICPKCGAGATADNKFCPVCGAQLPEMTVAESAVCPKCGKQNTIGTNFCAACGTKLPGKGAMEKAAAANDADVLAQWDKVLPTFPKWNLGGTNYDLECVYEYPNGAKAYAFRVKAASETDAQNLVTKYAGVCRAAGFHPAGQYASDNHLYNRINGVVYHVDFEHCFLGDLDCPEFSFGVEEPDGGYDYKKPENKQSSGLSGIFGLFK